MYNSYSVVTRIGHYSRCNSSLSVVAPCGRHEAWSTVYVRSGGHSGGAARGAGGGAYLPSGSGRAGACAVRAASWGYKATLL